MAEFKVFSDPSVPADPIYWVDAFGANSSFQDDVAGPGVTIAYGFKETGTSPDGGAAHVLSAAEKNQIRDAINKLAAHANVTFVETALASAEVVFAGGPANGGGGAAGATYFGGPQVEVWAYSDTPGNNSYIYKHELLHALGLDHSTRIFGNNINPIPDDEAVGTTLYGDWIPGFQNDYQLFDIAALQYLYGPPPTQRAGNDSYTLNPGVFDPASPQIQWPLLWDGGGFDTLDYSAFAVSVSVSLEPGELSRINGAAGGILDAGVFSINYRTVIEAAIGGSNTDQLFGNGAVNTLIGGAGNDTLDGRGGADTMNGQAGNDTYLVDRAGDVVVEAAGGGVADIVRASLSYTLAAGLQVERLETTNVAGTTAIRFNGNEFIQRIVGNAGGNVLDGRGGADTLEGRGGNDIYVVDNAADLVIEAAGNAGDVVYASVSYTLSAAAAIEVLGTTLAAGTTPINLTGNAFGQTLFGNAGNNVLNAAAGIDRLEGRNGNDRLDGGIGTDAMLGGAGNDTYIVDSASDVTIEAAGQGADIVATSVSYVLASGSHVEVVQTINSAATATINLTGNQLVNSLIGNAGVNSLNGKAGADTMRGLLGNDTYFVDNAADKVIELGNQGTDAVNAGVDYALQAGSAVETLRALGATTTAAIDLTGNAFNNTVVGNAGTNIINGGGGNDVLTGGGGSDTFLFNTVPHAAVNLDRITDFNVAADTIKLENLIFFNALGTTVGTLAANKFFKGAAAHDADDRIIYNAATGALIYDSNGIAAGGAVQFATLAKNLAITNADFVVV